MSGRIILGLSLSLLMFVVARSGVNASVSFDSPSFLFTAAKQYDPLAWTRGSDRFPAGAAIMVRDANGRHPLVPNFSASADPAVSFDGTRSLFAGKLKAQDPWQVWEITLAGGDPRRVTSGSEDCVRPFYLSDDRIVYARKTAGRFVLEVLALSGGKPLPLTFTPANSLPTDVLRDGRILFESIAQLPAGEVPEIYAVYSDGSGVESYRCDHGPARFAARQVTSGDIVFASAKGLAKFTSARAHEIPVAAPSGEYAGEVAETPSGDWLLAWRQSAKTPFELRFWTPGSAKLRPAADESTMNLLQPELIVTRTVPKQHPSGLHDWPNANLLCLNAYTSKYQFAAGSIQSVRLYTRDEMGKPKPLGTAAVERDGSFFIQVPTEQPLQIELLDAAGKPLKRESGFFWARRGEQRTCVGCHAGPETAPENAVPFVLLKSTTPADMTGTTASAAGGH